VKYRENVALKKSKISSSHTCVDEDSSLWEFMQQWAVYIC